MNSDRRGREIISMGMVQGVLKVCSEKSALACARKAAWTDNPRMDPFRNIHPTSPDQADTQHEPPEDR
jgi:hypothetical protein